MTEMNAEIKAELIAIGSVDVDESLVIKTLCFFFRPQHRTKINLLQIRGSQSALGN